MIKTNKYFKGSFMRQLGDDLQYFDLKQITDMEQEFKRHAQAALKAYRHWVIAFDTQEDQISILYGNLAGRMLRQDAENAVRAYWVIREDSRQAVHNYIARMRTFPIQPIEIAA